ncbi:hypothetical protein AJ87_27405 [Rhizobium yanglingense]|nr:hypothetical protein AJ87_27405 [Rhizobium yanglingense]
MTTLAILNYFFKAADRLSERYGCEKIKTIGDCVMVVAGLPTARSDHAEAPRTMHLNCGRRLSANASQENR